MHHMWIKKLNSYGKTLNLEDLTSNYNNYKLEISGNHESSPCRHDDGLNNHFRDCLHVKTEKILSLDNDPSNNHKEGDLESYVPTT